MVYLGYLGIHMIRGNESAIRDTALILSVEIVYFCAGVIVFWLLFPSPVIGVGFIGIARSALDPQVVTGYPVWGLISMLLLMTARKRSE